MNSADAKSQSDAGSTKGRARSFRNIKAPCRILHIQQCAAATRPSSASELNDDLQCKIGQSQKDSKMRTTAKKKVGRLPNHKDRAYLPQSSERNRPREAWPSDPHLQSIAGHRYSEKRIKRSLKVWSDAECSAQKLEGITLRHTNCGILPSWNTASRPIGCPEYLS